MKELTQKLSERLFLAGLQRRKETGRGWINTELVRGTNHVVSWS